MLRKHLPGATTLVVSLALSVGMAACGGGSKAAPTTTTPVTEAPTEPPTTPVPTTLPAPPTYVGSVPPAKCTAKVVAAETGMKIVKAMLPCHGPWFVDAGVAPAKNSKAKKTVTVYRWTGTAWQKRGQVPFTCTNDAVPAGMSTRIAALYGATLKGAQNGCSAGPATTPEPPTGPLSPGASGKRVTALQELLIAANLLRGTADGNYGSGTRAAIFDYQFLNSLPPTGIADDALLTAFAGWAVPISTATTLGSTMPASSTTIRTPTTAAN